MLCEWTPIAAIRIAAQRTQGLWGLISVFWREIWLPTNASDNYRAISPVQAGTSRRSKILEASVCGSLWGMFVASAWCRVKCWLAIVRGFALHLPYPPWTPNPNPNLNLRATTKTWKCVSISHDTQIPRSNWYHRINWASHLPCMATHDPQPLRLHADPLPQREIRRYWTRRDSWTHVQNNPWFQLITWDTEPVWDHLRPLMGRSFTTTHGEWVPQIHQPKMRKCARLPQTRVQDSHTQTKTHPQPEFRSTNMKGRQ